MYIFFDTTHTFLVWSVGHRWLNYESLLEGVVNSARAKNGPDVK